ncbi:hypothetical protein ES288_A11G260900v1 [Gossypium darwinii]|uniref:Uncharacterized protein n=1 Tax=Gossypium darwinii TaxID=34276 RepID=A0A5D2ENZ7_GOSDA|nr:hypothetical protein ES288_A11G260900v1 [Gossypium darwinii]
MAFVILVFLGLTWPTISIQSYLDRIYKYANCRLSCFIVAYVYLDWFAQRQSLSPFDSFNIHRLLITSVLVATKFIPSWTIGLLVTKDLRRVVKELLWS